ncbi:uncharacterized protein LOC111245312 isoform X1 [Varroa destructor]|uniref:RNase III domain-containing protein n=1 Tax=Varroa destructor TaxID=109461 RepID=A0A7M7JAV1_VARDE|nr:uncharacterized protein LOC111245312 isoform X1 [Varroa destructor]
MICEFVHLKSLFSRYRFTKREYLIKALLHKSYKAKRRRDRLDSFTLLDQIGDMVLNYMITRILIMNSQSNLNTKALSKMRSAILQRNAISFIAIKNKVDDYIFINEQHLANTSSTAKFKEQVKNLENYQALAACIRDPKHRPTSGFFPPEVMKPSSDQYLSTPIMIDDRRKPSSCRSLKRKFQCGIRRVKSRASHVLSDLNTTTLVAIW